MKRRELEDDFFVLGKPLLRGELFASGSVCGLGFLDEGQTRLRQK